RRDGESGAAGRARHRARVLAPLETAREGLRCLFVLRPSRPWKAGRGRRVRVPLPRRVDPHASRPGSAQGDDGGRGAHEVRILQPRGGGRRAAPWLQAMSALFVNHVLRGAPLALERMRKHAGRTVAFHVGPMSLAVTVQTTGEVVSAVPGAARDLEVRISPFLLPRLALREEAAYREIDMQGDMELAHEISYLARNLEWDVEEDLSKVVGDIAAHRVVGAARGAAEWGRDAALRLAQGAAEYWTEEDPVIASRVKVESFVREVADLKDALERLEKRLAKLG